MNHTIIPDLIIFSGAFLSLFLAIGQFVLRGKKKKNIFLALLLISFTIFQISNSFTLFYSSNEWYRWYQIVYPIGLTCFFFIGPLQYIYFKAIIETELNPPPFFIFHFLPGIIALLIMIFFHPKYANFSIPPENYLQFIRKQNPVYVIVSLCSVLSFSGYIAVLLKKALHLYTRSKTIKKTMQRIILFFIIFLIPALALWFTYFSGLIGILKAIHVYMTLYLVLIYLLSNRYPQFIHIIKIEADRDHYLQSQIKNIDVNMVIKDFNSLMNDEKLYRNEKINLKEISSRLNITPHQLSEILNNRVGENFFTLVNEFRILEAKGWLIQNPDDSILSIAYKVGFNSPSSFYSAFKKITGISPTTYRKKTTK